MTIKLQHISKRFGDEVLFDNLTLNFETPSSTALLGINGSGKSTLLQIIATYVLPVKGKVIYELNEKTIDPEEIYQYVSISAPYLELIEEMTLYEFLRYHFNFKKPLMPVDDMIGLIGLHQAKDKPIEKFSSGMKQRVKLAQALFADTPVLLLDEPCSNLDESGIVLYHDFIRQYTPHRLLIIASNDPQEYSMCKDRWQINQHR